MKDAISAIETGSNLHLTGSDIGNGDGQIFAADLPEFVEPGSS